MGGRAFVRPSGTEDILRLYVEAEHVEDVQVLADLILEEIETKFKDFNPEEEELISGSTCRCTIF